MTVFGGRCLIGLEESLTSVLVFEIYNLQEKKYFLSAFCITVDRIINCSARSAIVMCLPLSLAQSKTITPALSDQLSFPFDPNNFVSWLFLLVFTIVCLFVCWSTLSLQLPVCRSRQQLILISREPRAYSQER